MHAGLLTGSAAGLTPVDPNKKLPNTGDPKDYKSSINKNEETSELMSSISFEYNPERDHQDLLRIRKQKTLEHPTRKEKRHKKHSTRQQSVLSMPYSGSQSVAGKESVSVANRRA
eukprot:CAMPEP_0170508102 /NCGR_PEP_ID=MMETSP0208-20121228/61239_1 /TAXON_ID=197538 /ORGANISM="Strombidium inclinatum, Strain S3" /LENGTH=114 /DNA_ID=CAMNT_0010790787 /DNA_START=69 /DNA_END=413 /DNA_ORIENTATION=-